MADLITTGVDQDRDLDIVVGESSPRPRLPPRARRTPAQSDDRGSDDPKRTTKEHRRVSLMMLQGFAPESRRSDPAVADSCWKF